LVDLFCGSGGFTSGVKLAAEALGMDVHVLLAVDTDPEALKIYAQNHSPRLISTRSVVDMVDYQVLQRDGEWSYFYDPDLHDGDLSTLSGTVDLVVGGPPCQGHSNLNNHTRRDDGRNSLYPAAVSVGIALGAEGMLIENVQAVLRDAHQSIPKSRDLLARYGWQVDEAVLNAITIGWPQNRKRHFLSARRSGQVLPLSWVAHALQEDARPVSWAIDDLEQIEGGALIDTTPTLSRENVERIDYLFENDAYDLPNAVRPLKHRNGHTYPSSYGRLRWNEPSGTITTGFMTPGRGRFVHPRRRRPITPHEAARLQGFPDTYQFELQETATTRRSLGKWIGDAVPPPLGYAAAFSVLAGWC
jgi:DNA (cytosine-5)-methyltransferase 1